MFKWNAVNLNVKQVAVIGSCLIVFKHVNALSILSILFSDPIPVFN